jgi:PadR family transcriptional regulator AphA
VSLRHGLLGLLAGCPMSGYELTKTFDRSLRHVWSAQHSQIYPELARLQERGLIERVEEGPRGRKTYGITKAGRAELRRWLTETAPDRNERSESFLRLFFLWTLPLDEAISYLHRELQWHEAGLRGYEGIDRAGMADGYGPWGRVPLGLGLRYKAMMIEYLEWAIDELRRAHGAAEGGSEAYG